MDVLSEFFERTSLQGRLFFAGRVDGALVLDKPPGMAFIHLVEHGGIEMVQPGLPKVSIREPSVLFCPSSCRYQLRSSSIEGAKLICASFQFNRGLAQPFPLGLDETLVFPLDALGHALPVIHSLVGEFEGEEPGRAKALNLLFEYLFVLLVRRAVEDGRISGGLLYALQDGRLGTVLSQIHREPETDWSVERMASLALMSRSKFSACFNRIMGTPPMAYLTAWRMKTAQDLLREGVQIKVVAASVGYSSQASFSRTFANLVGCPPAEWIRKAARGEVEVTALVCPTAPPES
ncbi:MULTISPECIES: AraC family transcriptional regulator [unclassified Pseudomonas]|uniref:AraC family transcriptional regulator n=1 Tax=unclassified Pseudomonas TaxID=196821 RepID=UPI00129DBC06|nr:MULTISPECIES: AraC family transcriptional regulator [unclassified Pseudomonas]MDH4655841.1 AraC family transcriptional regulator [Pseudomonas sp. BN606]MRK21555.1 AraC family transcriptional regulator [Pseudomonas sp. JG-B]